MNPQTSALRMGRFMTTVKYVLLILGAFIVFFPFLWMLTTSLKTVGESISIPPTLLPEKLQWENFQTAWNMAPFPRYFGNTILIAVVGTLLTVTITIFAAYAFTVFRFRGKSLLFMVYLSTMMIPTELLLIQNYVTVTKMGLIDTYVGIILPTLASGFYTFMLREYFMQVPSSLYKAAKMDGCSNWRYLWKVMVPINRNAIATVTILCFITQWNAFVWPLMVTTSDEHRVLATGLMYFNLSASSAVNLQMAATTIVVAPMVVFYCVFRRQIVSGIARGGIKG